MTKNKAIFVISAVLLVTISFFAGYGVQSDTIETLTRKANDAEELDRSIEALMLQHVELQLKHVELQDEHIKFLKEYSQLQDDYLVLLELLAKLQGVDETIER